MVCRAKRTRLYEGQSSERVSGLLWRSRNEGGGCYLTTLLTRVTWLGMRPSASRTAEWGVSQFDVPSDRGIMKFNRERNRNRIK